MTFKGTIKIEPEEEWYVATCLENSIASQGKTIEEAKVSHAKYTNGKNIYVIPIHDTVAK